MEATLTSVFGGLVAFVREAEAEAAADARAKEAGDGGRVSSRSREQLDAQLERLVGEFAARWRAGIEQTHQVVMGHFAEALALVILKQALTQLLLYYTRLQDVARRRYAGQRPPFHRKIVPTSQILAEIRNYSPS